MVVPARFMTAAVAALLLAGTQTSARADGNGVVAVLRPIEATSPARLKTPLYSDLPVMCRVQHVGGTATVTIDIDAGGRLTNAAVAQSSGNIYLDRKAVDIAHDGRYVPARAEGKNIGGTYLLDVFFDPDA